MRRYLYTLVPLLVLLIATSLACLLGYIVIENFDTSWTLRKIIKKSTQVFLLLSVIPAMFYLKMSAAELGFAQRQLFLKQLRHGFIIGFVTLMPVFIALYVLDVSVIDSAQPWTWVWLGKKLILELLLALLVSFFEEPIFRGIMLAGFKRQLPVTIAIVMTAFYYAVLHFLDTELQIPRQDLNLFSGFKLFGNAVMQIFNPHILSAFSSLFLVGIFLGVLRTRIPVSLGVCIGCHTCWVWQIKLSKTLFNTNYHADYAYIVSKYDGVIGPIVTLWLATAMAAYFLYQKFKTSM